MGKCTECAEGTMRIVKYVCREKDFALLEDSGDVIEVYETHGFPNGDSEIGDVDRFKLCSCGKRFEV